MGQQVLDWKVRAVGQTPDEIMASAARTNPLGRNATEADVADAVMLPARRRGGVPHRRGPRRRRRRPPGLHARRPDASAEGRHGASRATCGGCGPARPRSTGAATPPSGPRSTRCCATRASSGTRSTLWGDLVFSHLEVPSYAELVARFNGDPVAQRWEAEMGDVLEYPNADPQTGLAGAARRRCGRCEVLGARPRGLRRLGHRAVDGVVHRAPGRTARPAQDAGSRSTSPASSATRRSCSTAPSGACPAARCWSCWSTSCRARAASTWRRSTSATGTSAWSPRTSTHDFERLRGIVEFRDPEPTQIPWGPYAGGWACYLRDPDGISIEILQAPPGGPRLDAGPA